jgi:hypothetical protein
MLPLVFLPPFSSLLPHPLLFSFTIFYETSCSPLYYFPIFFFTSLSSFSAPSYRPISFPLFSSMYFQGKAKETATLMMALSIEIKLPSMFSSNLTSRQNLFE